MKRVITIILFAVCFLAIGSWSYAQCKGCDHGCDKCASTSETDHGKCFVDDDGDGICDNVGNANCKCKGQCQKCKAKNTGSDSQHGSHYVDKDEDGKCDHSKQNQDKTE